MASAFAASMKSRAVDRKKGYLMGETVVGIYINSSGLTDQP